MMRRHLVRRRVKANSFEEQVCRRDNETYAASWRPRYELDKSF
jgi:hypothetical protein